MADLFHLDDELNQPQQEQGAEEEESIGSANSPVNDFVDDQDREIIDLPPALAKAAKQKTVQTSSFEDDRLDLKDFATQGNLKEREEYRRIQHWWVQELQAPELLPWDGEILAPLMEAVFSEDDGEGLTDGTSLETILNEIRAVDKERVQFILANLLQVRLQKIQACPWFYMNNKQRLRKAEVSRRRLLVLSVYTHMIFH